MFGKHDPVCGIKVSKNTEYFLEHKGKTYFFDCQACQATFKENPNRFIKKGNGLLKRMAKEIKDVPKCCHEMKQKH